METSDSRKASALEDLEMSEYPEDIMKLVDDSDLNCLLSNFVFSANFDGDTAKERKEIQDFIAGLIMAERQRQVTVVMENDFPVAVFSTSERAAAWAESAAVKDPTSPFATRIHRHHHQFVVDAELNKAG